ncbi:MAG: hypothetical protein GY716_13145 [bacterium]|nr:hypothetical protein [bacterium]
MPPIQERAPLRAQQGSAMVLAIFVLVLLTGMAISSLFLGENELKMSRADLSIKKTFYIAETGLEDGRATLLDVHVPGEDLSNHLDTYSGTDDTINFDADTISVEYNDDGSFKGFTGYGDDVPLRAATAKGDGWYIAFVTNDPGEGETNTTDTNDILMITGIGTTGGRSLQIVQALVDPDPILPTPPPAAILLLGPNPDFSGGGYVEAD